MALLRRAGLAFVLMSLGKVVSYLAQVALTHINTTHDYGQYAYAMSICSTIAVFASLGFNNSLVRFVPEYLKLKKYAELHGFLNTARIVTFVGSTVLYILTFIILMTGPQGFNWQTAGLFALTVPLMAYMHYYSELSRSVGSIKSSIVPNSLIQPALVLIVLCFIYIITGSSNATDIALSIVTAYLIGLTPFRGLSKYSRVWRSASPIYSVRKWTAISSTMILMVGFQSILAQADIIVVGSFLAPDATGFYNIATKMAALASFSLIAVNQVFAPTIASIYSAGDIKRLQLELSKASILTFIPTVLICTVLYIETIPILSIFGKEYLGAENVMHILIIGQVINASAGPVGYVLNLTGHHNVSTRIFGVSAALNIVSCLVAAKLGGTLDAVAWASTSSVILWNVWMHISVTRRLKLWPSVLGVLIYRRGGGWRNL